MAYLKSGEYTVKTTKQVIVWPAPDMNGTGDQVWENDVDTVSGVVLGVNPAHDKHGNEIYSYDCPEGFRNVPSYDHQDHFVMVDKRNRVIRQPNGEAIEIKPGQALVLHPDGSAEVLPDGLTQHVFNQLHEEVSTTSQTDVVSE